MSDNFVRSYRYFLITHSSSVLREGQRAIVTRQCDLDALARFFPIGRMPRVTVTCEVRQTIGEGAEERRSSFQETWTISHEGESVAHVRLGDMAVKTIRVAIDGRAYHNDGVLLFSERLGTSVLVENEGRSTQGDVVTTTVIRSEMIEFHEGLVQK